MTDSIYKLKTGYSIAADGDYVAVGNPTSFLSGSFVLNNKGSVEVFKYSKTTDLYNPNSFAGYLLVILSNDLYFISINIKKWIY